MWGTRFCCNRAGASRPDNAERSLTIGMWLTVCCRPARRAAVSCALDTAALSLAGPGSGRTSNRSTSGEVTSPSNSRDGFNSHTVRQFQEGNPGAGRARFRKPMRPQGLAFDSTCLPPNIVPVAQRIERRITNPQAAGLSPAGDASLRRG